MQVRKVIIIGIALSSFATTTSVATAETLSCSARSKDGTAHSLEVEVSNGEVVSLSYTSANQQGHTCDVGALKYEKKRWEKSTWDCKSGACTITTFLMMANDEYREHSRIRLVKEDMRYRIIIVAAMLPCGTSGYIASEAILYPKSSTCELREETKTKYLDP